MDAGVDHQARGAEEFGREAAEVHVGVGEETELLREIFRVKRPALDVGGVAAIAAETRDALEFLRDGDLHVVARDGLVVGERLHLVDRETLHLEGVHVIHAGARTVGRRLLVKRRGAAFLAERLDLAQFERGLREDAEELGQARAHGVDEARRAVEIGLFSLGRVRIVILRRLAQVDEELLQRAGEADLVLDRRHLGVDPRDFAQTDPVDLVGAEVGRRETAQLVVVILAAVREFPRAVVGRRDLLLRLEHGDEFFVGGLDAVDQRRAGVAL